MQSLVSGQEADLAAIDRIFDGSRLMTVYKRVGSQARVAAEAAMKIARHEAGGVTERQAQHKAILLKPICVNQENAKQTLPQHGFEELEVVKQASPKRGKRSWITKAVEDIAERIVRDRTRMLGDELGQPPGHVIEQAKPLLKDAVISSPAKEVIQNPNESPAPKKSPVGESIPMLDKTNPDSARK